MRERAAARALAGDNGDARGGIAGTASIAEFVPGYEASAWFGIAAPKNTPPDIVERLNAKSMRASLIPSSTRGLPTSAAWRLRARLTISEG